MGDRLLYDGGATVGGRERIGRWFQPSGENVKSRRGR